MGKLKVIGLYLALLPALMSVPAYAASNNTVTPTAVVEKSVTDGIHKTDGKYYYYRDNKLQHGLKTVVSSDGTKNKYLFGEDGAALTGPQEYNGKYYYFQNNGKAFCSGLLKYEKNGKTVYSYFKTDGTAYTKGYKAVTGGYEINENGKAVAMKDNTKTYYYFRADGRAFTGGYLKFNLADGKTCYRYFDKDGRMFTGGYKIAYGCYTGTDGVVTSPEDKTAIRLYFLPDGRKYTGGLLTFTNADGYTHTYYFKSNGAAFTDGYKKAAGGAVVKETGAFPEAVKDTSSHIYYFQPNGRAFNKGVLSFKRDGSTVTYFFNSDGQADGSGYRRTTRYYVADKKGNITAQPKQYYGFYITNNKQAYNDGFLQFVHSDGKTCYVYFSKNGTALASKTLNIKKRHAVDKNGKIIDISDDKVYGYTFGDNSKGKPLKNIWLQTDEKWAYYDDSGVRLFRSDKMYEAWSKIKDLGSMTDYYVVVDTEACETYTFTGKAGKWVPAILWKCSPGKPSTPTVKGFYNVTGKGYCFHTDKNTCYYTTQFYGDYLFHSITYKRGTMEPDDARLGKQLSHGCVRLSIENAKWFYDNLPIGTRVYIY